MRTVYLLDNRNHPMVARTSQELFKSRPGNIELVMLELKLVCIVLKGKSTVVSR